VIKEQNRENAAYKSKASRNPIKPYLGPGVGEYNTNDHFSLSQKVMTGGAPNNFTLLSKNGNQSLRPVEIKEQARIPVH